MLEVGFRRYTITIESVRRCVGDAFGMQRRRVLFQRRPVALKDPRCVKCRFFGWFHCALADDPGVKFEPPLHALVSYLVPDIYEC